MKTAHRGKTDIKKMLLAPRGGTYRCGRAHPQETDFYFPHIQTSRCLRRHRCWFCFNRLKVERQIFLWTCNFVWMFALLPQSNALIIWDQQGEEVRENQQTDKAEEIERSRKQIQTILFHYDTDRQSLKPAYVCLLDQGSLDSVNITLNYHSGKTQVQQMFEGIRSLNSKFYPPYKKDCTLISSWPDFWATRLSSDPIPGCLLCSGRPRVNGCLISC